MKESIMKRLEDMERICKPNPLIVLCETESGEEEMTVSECIRRNAVFLRVVCGGSYKDLDRLLQSMKESAQQELDESTTKTPC